MPDVVIGFPLILKKDGTDASTLVTVPVPPPVAAMVIEPFPLVMETPLPAVRVAFVRVFPTVLPIKS